MVIAAVEVEEGFKEVLRCKDLNCCVEEQARKFLIRMVATAIVVVVLMAVVVVVLMAVVVVVLMAGNTVVIMALMAGTATVVWGKVIAMVAFTIIEQIHFKVNCC